jgi:hypothetical protein
MQWQNGAGTMKRSTVIKPKDDLPSSNITLDTSMRCQASVLGSMLEDDHKLRNNFPRNLDYA